MPTNIKCFQNESDRSVIAFNSENVGNSFRVPEKASLNTNPGLWISWHQDVPLILCTSKGVCHVWDSDWKVNGLWEGTSYEVVFLEGADHGVGGDIKVSIDANGDVQMSKA